MGARLKHTSKTEFEMTVPATFPPHWRAAIESGEARFADRADIFAFFKAVDDPATWSAFTAEERQSTFSINGQYEDDRMVYLHNAAALKAGRRLIGNSIARTAPTLAELRPEIEAINAEIEEGRRRRHEGPKASSSWAGVIEHINAAFDRATGNARRNGEAGGG
ncbi:hypothetical protein EN851_27135 [Mesorhizobium sp. M8A.F.Ca.ET.208.01.1.1]|uniref:hypothetical protein n=1 Tax=unclassified Mesorhizobium TaxID=325217 RepID=UPI0010936E3D|nr:MULTISPECIES: hypothetical protein [unclassified Mesorhizobium]TGQ87697.1 hypothetical protein EN851_27135 [Mesorhizobium sp. M8A.F.Ca.ET.208.01.1.1]TGT49427.1 hypothetical protein EN810_27035 [Mesorhizobium sp. M8A.F.Ca.ET.167.01.1.1]